MNQKKLQELVENISLKFFEKEFCHQAVFNSRLRTTGGRYLMRSHHLEFNPRVWEQCGEEELIGVIKHELCHYHLHLEGRGYQHKDRDFKELLKQTGGIRYVQDLRTEEEKNNGKVYLCSRCGNKLYRKKKLDTKKYVCGKCRGILQLVR